MSHFSNVKKELNDICQILSKYKIYSDSRFLIDEDNKIISWSNYDKGISKKHYFQIFRNLISGRQYSFQFKDGSFLQFYYKFSQEDVLEKAKLAYYPIPKTCNDLCDDDLLEYIKEYEYTDTDLWEILSQEIKLTNTSHIRIDYDKSVTSHDICEIQIDGIKEIRIPCEILINPIYFFEFILKCKAFVNDNISEVYAKLCNDSSFKTRLNISKQNLIMVDNFSSNNLFVTFTSQ